jgi:hypothetical protein
LKNVYVGRNADAGIGEFETHRAYIPARCDPQISAIGHGVRSVPEREYHRRQKAPLDFAEFRQ